MMAQGRMRGNMQYCEDKWLVQINPVNLIYKNEPDWSTNNGSSDKVPIELGQSPIPDQILSQGSIEIPDTLNNRGITTWGWKEVEMKEAKIKDKWMKVRIRYYGDKLAVISAIKTLYSISYS